MYKRILTSHLPNLSNSFRVPPSTEAFVAFAMDCYSGVWKEQFAFKQEFGPKAKLPKARASGGVVSEKDQKWVAKYTSPDTGSKKLSGWSP